MWHIWPLPGAIVCEKNIIRMRPKVCKGQTDKGYVSILLYVCTLYFTLVNLGLYMYQQMKAVENPLFLQDFISKIECINQYYINKVFSICCSELSAFCAKKNV